MLMNPFEISAVHIILIIAGILAGFYFIIPSLPTKNMLHVRNMKKAKLMLTELNMTALENPALAFGILRKLNPFVFEELLLLAFKKHYFRVEHNQRYTGDGGIDGTVFDKQGNKYLVQAKRYKSAINPTHVRNFAYVVSQQQAHAGFFIHTGRTGEKSYQNIGANIQIISGKRLLNLLTGKPFL